jgi:uncharacterized damage-inducible protein DinB
MKRVGVTLIGCLALVAGAAARQPVSVASQTPAKPTSVTMVASGPITTSIRAGHDEVKDYILRSAQMVTEKEFEFRPAGVSADVRNFGQILGHIANVNYAYCGAAIGKEATEERGPKGEDFQTVTSKVEMQKALAASFAFCDKAYNAVNDHNGGEPAKAFGHDTTKLGVLAANNAHENEHYGNLVTYLRAMGKVPPSSQR